MTQFVQSVVKWFAPFSYEKGVRYGKDVTKYAFSSLCAFPPDLVPLVVLVGALSSTLLVCSNLFRGKIKGMDWALLIGAWSGLHAVIENRSQKELKKTVADLSRELSRTEENLEKVNKMKQEENEKLNQIESIACSFQVTVEKITEMVREVEKQVERLNASIQSSSQLIEQTKLASRRTEQVGKSWEDNIEKSSGVLTDRIQRFKAIEVEQKEMLEQQQQLERGLLAKVAQLQKLQKGDSK